MSSRSKKRAEFRKEAPEVGRERKLADFLADRKEQMFHELDKRAVLGNLPMVKDMIAESYKEGQIAGGQELIQCVYAGLAMALHDEFKFGKERIYKALSALEKHIQYALNHYELCEELLENYGIEIDIDDMFERVKKK